MIDMHVHAYYVAVMRTTVEISDSHRARLLKLAADRGEKGFSHLVREALDQYLDDDDHAAGLAAADVRRALEKSGDGIGMADYQIAGICVSRGAALWTRNTAHFERVPGLRLA